LRVDDHLGLAEAAKLADVVPVLVLDPVRSARLRSSPRSTKRSGHAAAG
jgi:hypothetical protein